jgi:hypothetical protein
MSAPRLRRDLDPEQARLFDALMAVGSDLRTCATEELRTHHEVCESLLASPEVAQRAGSDTSVENLAYHANEAIREFTTKVRDPKDRLAIEAGLAMGDFEYLKVTARIKLLAEKPYDMLKDTFMRRREKTLVKLVCWLRQEHQGASSKVLKINVSNRACDSERVRWELLAVYQDSLRLSYSLAACMSVREFISTLRKNKLLTEDRVASIGKATTPCCDLFAEMYSRGVASMSYCLKSGPVSDYSLVSSRVPSVLLTELETLRDEIVEYGPFSRREYNVELLIRGQIGELSLAYREKEETEANTLKIRIRNWFPFGFIPNNRTIPDDLVRASLRMSESLYGYLGTHRMHPFTRHEAFEAVSAFLDALSDEEIASLPSRGGSLDTSWLSHKAALAWQEIEHQCGLVSDEGRSELEKFWV